ncbi:type IV toxin-antitoxin system AbiEi family antitoxin domain-containing protein [Naumannella huperziae]
MLAEITAYQWGMVTSAQASMHGISRLDLSRLAADGQLERIAHGVYKDVGAPAGPHDNLKAAWLSTDPKTMGEARIKDLANGVVVAGESAADVHGIGDFRTLRHEFVSPVRRQSQRSTIRYRQRTLDPGDVTLIDGLPVMTMERTVADLIEEVGDLSLVADALRDAFRAREINLGRLRSLLAPLAQRNGFRNGDGAALLDRLMEIAGIDPGAVARRVAASFFVGLSREDLGLLVMTPEMQQTIQELVAAVIRSAVGPTLTDIHATMALASADLVKNTGLDEISTHLVNSGIMEKLSQGWATALSDNVVLKEEALAATRTGQRAPKRD